MFRRQIEILQENQKYLEDKVIAIIGAGGLGNVVMSQMNCIGLKEIYLVDFDVIEIHNIHRQFNFTIDDVGKFKSDVLKEKTQRCNTTIHSITKKFEDIDIKVDLIIDCSDNFEVRQQINDFAKKNSIPWLYGSVENWIGQVCLFKDKNLDIFNITKHKVDGVMPAMVGVIGSIQAVVATKYLANLEVEFDKLYYIDFKKELKIMGFGI